MSYYSSARYQIYSLSESGKATLLTCRVGDTAEQALEEAAKDCFVTISDGLYLVLPSGPEGYVWSPNGDQVLFRWEQPTAARAVAAGVGR